MESLRIVESGFVGKDGLVVYLSNGSGTRVFTLNKGTFGTRWEDYVDRAGLYDHSDGTLLAALIRPLPGNLLRTFWSGGRVSQREFAAYWSRGGDACASLSSETEAIVWWRHFLRSDGYQIAGSLERAEIPSDEALHGFPPSLGENTLYQQYLCLREG